MKRIIVVATVLLLSVYTLQAQKIYSTKSGKVTFYSKAPLEDIEAKNSEVESKLAPSNGQMVFSLLIRGFQFPNQLMQEHFNENYLESSKYPKSDFKGFITNIKEIDFNKDGSYPAKVSGKLTIHGVTRDVQTEGVLDVKGGKVIGKSSFTILLKDYNIGGSLIGKKIAETITINVVAEYD